MIDIHAHIYEEKLIERIDEVLKNAKNAGVEKIVCVGSSISNSKKCIALAEKYENVYAVIGVHPDDAEKFDDEAEKFLRANATHPKVIAIGEIGLDFHYDPHDKQKQKDVFVKQLEIADEVGLPIQIHSRDATGMMIETLQENKHLLKNGGIIHCYSGSVETLKQILGLGLSISLGGIVTFKNARALPAVVSDTPIEKLLLETDAPYLAPVPHRGETNNSAMIHYVAEKMAEIKEISKNEVLIQTFKNAKKLFNI